MALMAGEAHRDKNGEIGKTGKTSADGDMVLCGEGGRGGFGGTE
jgi:hypothetical protein